jgi:hypothetical protein
MGYALLSLPYALRVLFKSRLGSIETHIFTDLKNPIFTMFIQFQYTENSRDPQPNPPPPPPPSPSNSCRYFLILPKLRNGNANMKAD